MKDWRCWCRLCANPDSNCYTLESKAAGLTNQQNLQDIIKKLFGINFRRAKTLSIKLCANCYTLIVNIDKFALRVAKVQQMFEDLQQNPHHTSINYDALRQKYGFLNTEEGHIHWKRYNQGKVNLKPQNDCAEISDDTNTIDLKATVENSFAENKQWSGNITDDVQENVQRRYNMKNKEFTVEHRPFKRKRKVKVHVEKHHTKNDNSFKLPIDGFPQDNLLITQGEVLVNIPTNMLNSDFEREPIAISCDNFSAERNREEKEISKDSMLKNRVMHIPLNERKLHSYKRHGTKFHSKHAVQQQGTIDNVNEQISNTIRQEKVIEDYDCTINAANEVLKNGVMITCPKCPQEFNKMVSYRTHMKKVHSITLEPPEYLCPKCLRVFSTNTTLQRHIRLHYIPLEERKKFSCQFCSKKFLTNFLARNHERRVHMKEGAVICELCGLELCSESALRVHVLKHKGETPFKCEICNRGYREKSKLKIHMDRHDDKKKICTVCDRQFNSRLNLQRHMIVHSEDKRFKCEYCGKTFKRAKSLKIHLILHTGLKPFSCNFCDRTFSTGSSCRLHKKTQHPEELAALEAAGGGVEYAFDVPDMKTLKAMARTGENLRPVGKSQR